MTKNQRLYNELRKFVDKDKVQEYDNEFFGQKRLTYKFLISYFNRYMNLELVKDKMTDARAQAHLKDQLNKLLVSNNKDWHRIKKATRGIEKVKYIPRHIDKEFLYRNPDSKYPFPKYKE